MRKHRSSTRLARFMATVSLCALAALGTACHGRARTETTSASSGAPTTPDPRSGPAIALVDVSGGLSELNEGGFMGIGPKKHSFDEVLRVLDKIHKDKDDRGVLVRFGSVSVGLARAQELGEALEAVRKDKPVYCHADGYSNATMYAAARGCSKIYASPAGEVNAIGIAAQVVYMRRLLADQLHFNIDFLQVGKFKGAEEPLTRDGPSAEARESLESVLADMRASWLDGIKAGRAANAGAADAAEDGPYSVAKAKEKGLIDEVGYLDEARDHEKAATGAVREAVRFGGAQADDGDDLGDLLSALGGQGSSSGPIALLRASGQITMSGGGGLLGGGGITEKELGRQIARLTKDDRVKAVVLRIDSPGGSALASDLLWHDLMRLRAKKPIVVSVGDMAASGGYYLACSGNVIFADPASIVGSIGVVGGKIGVGDALEKIGVHAETFAAKRGDPKAAKRAAYESIVNNWDDDTRARVLESMTAIYNLFLQRISEGRKLPVDKIALSAEGRIFSGRQGKERGLVDELGGLTAAIARARELAKLPADARVTVAESAPKFLESLVGGDSDAEGRAPVDPAGEVSRLTPWAPSRGVIELVQQLAPELVPFIASISPLANHERSVTALPFALTIR
jgi:protease IV